MGGVQNFLIPLCIKSHKEHELHNGENLDNFNHNGRSLMGIGL